jgi:hypothetical protein
MKKAIILLGSLLALVLAGTAGATLVPGVFDPGSTGCPVATYSSGVLHLEKNCPTTTNAAAGADITGLAGQTFTSAAFTLASTAQCNGGSPRFDIVTTDATFFLGCNNVIPVLNGDGTATYTFDAATLVAGGSQVPLPTGTISSADVLIDVQGTADLTNISVNGVAQVPVVVPVTKAGCKKGGWKTFTDPKFKNQGQCVAYANHHSSTHGQASSKPDKPKHQK